MAERLTVGELFDRRLDYPDLDARRRFGVGQRREDRGDQSKS